MINANEAAKLAWSQIKPTNEVDIRFAETISLIWNKINDSAKQGKFTTFYGGMSVETFEYVNTYFKKWGYKTDDGYFCRSDGTLQIRLFW